MARLKTDATEAQIQDWCCTYLARALRLKAEKIDRTATFASIGLDSAEALFLVSALEDWSGLDLDSDTAYEHPSVAQLSRFVIECIQAQSPGR
ncbi:MAG TPA: acyl carrier protein [Acetobacteraceae bacterium]|jgi:acyl carrier protein|nr:acyl carrier protein [Acetobacteraceae bacterium]